MCTFEASHKIYDSQDSDHVYNSKIVPLFLEIWVKQGIIKNNGTFGFFVLLISPKITLKILICAHNQYPGVFTFNLRYTTCWSAHL